jgi:hypothetical protein
MDDELDKEWGELVDQTVKWINKDQIEIIKRVSKINKLRFVIPPKDESLNSEYMRAIKLTHDDIVYLFGLGCFPFAVLDHCRRLIELLVRQQQRVKAGKRIRGVSDRISELPWDEEDITIAKNIYVICCNSVHFHPEVLFRETAKKADWSISEKKYLALVRDSEGFDYEEYKRTKLYVDGHKGLEPFTLETINSVFRLVEKYCVSKPK